MDWITRKANERNAEQHRTADIERGASSLWENVCRSIDQAVRYYQGLDSREQDLAYGGPADHTVFVAVHERARPRTGPEVSRVTFRFEREGQVIKVLLGGKKELLFPLSLDSRGHACLTFEGKEITVEKFTELALTDAMFPPPGLEAATIKEWDPGNYRRPAAASDDD